MAAKRISEGISTFIGILFKLKIDELERSKNTRSAIIRQQKSSNNDGCSSSRGRTKIRESSDFFYEKFENQQKGDQEQNYSKKSQSSEKSIVKSLNFAFKNYRDYPASKFGYKIYTRRCPIRHNL